MFIRTVLMNRTHRRWNSRGYLPHCDEPGKIEAWLDAGHGSCALRDPVVAAMVEDALLFGDGPRYGLLAWVIMPNHVHFLFEMADGWPLGEVIHGVKSFTSHEANRILHRSGNFWYHDYRDRYVRDLEHLRDITRYIHENPVKAGLVANAEDWRWSSARFAPREPQRFIKLQEELCVSAPLREANRTVSRAEAQRRRVFGWCRRGIIHQPEWVK